MTRDTITLAERYVLQETIASGGMATVWRARDDVLARPVAVKILHPQLSQDEAFLERFRREALSAAQLAHPHIVSIYDTGSERSEVDGVERFYIVMELCGGGTLAQLLEDEGPMEPDTAAAVVATVCDALAYAHRNGVVHRDIKPQNVLLSEQRTLKVADFGIAKAAFTKSDITATGAILGTVTYLSPEQVMGRESGPQTDIYSTGILLYELLVGRPPFEAETPIATAMAHAREAPPSLRSQRAGIPRSLDEIVQKALAKEPADRFGSAEEMATALRNLAPDSSATGVLEAPAPPPRTAHRPASLEFRWLIPALVLVALAVAAAFVIPGLFDDGGSPFAPGNGNGDPGAQPIEVRGVADFDPLGDNSEHPEEASAAADGDPSSTWGTETYSTPMHEQKEGVGLVFDLGNPTEVAGARVVSPTPGYSMQIRSSNEEGQNIDDFELVAEVEAAAQTEELPFDEPREARYWLVLLTRLPEESGSAEIAEVKFLGP